MTKNIFVGGIAYETTKEELEQLFSTCGKVSDVKLIMDRHTGRSKGFGFVEMATEEDAQTAMTKLNGATLGRRQIFLSEARPQAERTDDAPPSAPSSAPRAPRAAGSGDNIPGTPGFVERRSGRDRRAHPPTPSSSGEDRGGFGAKRWEKRPGGFDRKKPWERKPAFGEKKEWGSKPGGFGGPKKWGDKPGFRGPKKFGDKPGFGGPRKFGDKPGFSGPKKWGDKPSFGGPKKWGDKPGFRGPKKFGDKPSFGGPKKFGDKPGGFKKKWTKKPFKPGGFKRD
ncbi:MAG: RNA-binding protein [Elusimicrobiota bacterium]|jgi:RNA recognition motif-containing protein